MKGPTTVSTIAHIAVLTWGLVSLSGPKPLVVADVEALPIDIVPIEEVTKAVQGEKKADPSEKPAPLPTQRPQTVPEARNVGEADADTKSRRPPEVEPRAVDTERAEAPPKAAEPTPAPEVKSEPVTEPARESEPTPTNEIAALNEPPVPVRQEPENEAAPAESEAVQEFAKLPDNAPVPERRPEPPKPRTAETQQRKQPKETPKPEQTAASQRESESTVDEIAALLNKEKPSAGGAKRSTDQASLGTKRSSDAPKLSQSEMDALRGAIERCWSVPAGLADAEEMRVTIRMRLTQDGDIEGRPEVEATGGEAGARRSFAESAERAVRRCAPYSLPVEKYETWAEVVVNFDPSQMF